LCLKRTSDLASSAALSQTNSLSKANMTLRLSGNYFLSCRSTGSSASSSHARAHKHGPAFPRRLIFSFSFWHACVPRR
jgi:hypothetical protein